MSVDLSVRSFVLSTGERYSLVVDRRSGVPIHSPSLYLTCRVRNSSKSHATMAASAGCLVILLRFCADFGIDLEERFRAQHYLEYFEVEAFRDFCTYNFDRWAGYAEVTLEPLKFVVKDKRRVASATLHRRLSVAMDYLEWFAWQHLSHLEHEPYGLQKMRSALLHSRPLTKGRNSGTVDKALSDAEHQHLKEALEINSPKNPFQPEVRSRNRLIVLLEDALGIRGGELLNIRVEDFDFSNNTLVIVRRADQYDDTRRFQPLVKTLDRELPVASWLMGEVHRYILKDRRHVRGANKCPYLFITYKSGPTQGKALSIAGYKKIWKTLQSSGSALEEVTGHRLRHTWNNRFSEMMDSDEYDLTEAEQEAARSRLMGWQEGSGTARRYNKRFIEKQAYKASILLQTKAWSVGAS